MILIACLVQLIGRSDTSYATGTAALFGIDVYGFLRRTSAEGANPFSKVIIQRAKSTSLPAHMLVYISHIIDAEVVIDQPHQSGPV